MSKPMHGGFLSSGNHSTNLLFFKQKQMLQQYCAGDLILSSRQPLISPQTRPWSLASALSCQSWQGPCSSPYIRNRGRQGWSQINTLEPRFLPTVPPMVKGPVTCQPGQLLASKPSDQASSPYSVSYQLGGLGRAPQPLPSSHSSA